MSQTSLVETSFLCDRYGHFWRATSRHGIYRCHNCKVVAYCPRCLLFIPQGDVTILCIKHKEELMSAQYKRPTLPDMQENGLPHITTLRSSRCHKRTTEESETQAQPTSFPHRIRPRRVVGILIIIALLILGVILFIQQVAVPWWNNSVSNQWNYGTSRVTNLDASVGHGSTSHFVAQYYNHTIMVIEVSLSNPSSSKTYVLTGMEGVTDTPVILLAVQDINHDGKPDLVIKVQGTSFEIILYNNGQTFQQGVPQ